MLKITPPDAINFTKSGNELVGTFEITNIDEKPITYKVDPLFFYIFYYN